MKRPRFTVRRLMVTVAIVGLAIGVSRWLWLRSLAFERLANFHGSRAMGGLPGNFKDWPRLSYHGSLSEKYRRAARYPWLPVAPDPPEPE